MKVGFGRKSIGQVDEFSRWRDETGGDLLCRDPGGSPRRSGQGRADRVSRVDEVEVQAFGRRERWQRPGL